MTTEHQEQRVLDALDDNPGPALPLSPAAAAAQADRLVARMRAMRSVARLTQLGAAGAVVTTGALVLLFRSSPLPPPARAPAVVTPPRAAEVAPGQVDRDPPSATSDAREVLPGQPRDWLELANAARAARDFVGAERLYLRVVSLYPSSDDAAAARLAAADLRALQLGRAREAIGLYRELIAARPNGALAEQACAGLARAYAALGERAAERTAWLELLRAHPRTLFSQEARARLKGLD